ncbi:hypothetical protein Ppa06_56840 [Planomonospora parontospora subsp. parontospora]|uniref:DUF305 domain-containing protein n=2 Tax=Planomonospora parontospora TaxID=58119 RepID=A0AA37BNE2_9ACTN|nr:DUF305 domain-containing protein [Planomonospora parontospora]GGK98516.1 hypothetical protein GCM10010126_67370 [Planomonospora parontospora]GII11886.1 hypothetical protein Ppa06_56840 [Planomonospora parontospora subsp. parontospora]
MDETTPVGDTDETVPVSARGAASVGRLALALALAVTGVLALSGCGTEADSHGRHAGHGAGPHAGHAARVPAAEQSPATAPASGNPAATVPAEDGLTGTGSPAGTGRAVAVREDGPAGAGSFNDADVMFLQMMIPHNRQGAELAGLAGSRSARGTVKALAAAIAATQDQEAEAMAGRLERWRRPLEAEAHAHDAHGGLHVTGPEEAVALRRATGAAFDVRFLNVMVAHQHNAVEMARAEIRDGRHPEVVELARRIDLSRSAQIKAMLGELAS